jgi:hypothetical protein
MKKKNKKSLLQQDFPTIKEVKTIIDKQQDKVMESHEFSSKGKMLKNEEENNEVVLG